jgi:hypothetical protein
MNNPFLPKGWASLIAVRSLAPTALMRCSHATPFWTLVLCPPGKLLAVRKGLASEPRSGKPSEMSGRKKRAEKPHSMIAMFSHPCLERKARRCQSPNQKEMWRSPRLFYP